MCEQVITEGRLILEFTFDDLMRIRSWHFAIRQHRELIPRSIIGMQVSMLHEQNLYISKTYNNRHSLILYVFNVKFTISNDFKIRLFLNLAKIKKNYNNILNTLYCIKKQTL